MADAPTEECDLHVQVVCYPGLNSTALRFDDNCLSSDGGGGAQYQPAASLGRIRLWSSYDAPYVVVKGRPTRASPVGVFRFASSWRVIALPLPANATVVERRAQQ